MSENIVICGGSYAVKNSADTLPENIVICGGSYAAK